MGIAHTDHDDREISLSGDDARGGVTGHNVRYVLGFGLTGVILAFAAVWIYLGYDRFAGALASTFAASPADVLRNLAPYAGLMLAGAVGAGLLLGLVNMIAGRSEDASQFWMRVRVIAQFAIICVLMAML
jgi:hypothetical protein